MSDPIPVETLSHEEWLRLRRDGIGASEAAAVLGVSPFESARQLYLRKRGLIPDVEETEAMRWGTLLEPPILREYERRSGETIAARQLFYPAASGSPMLATLDAMTQSGHPVEVKTTSAIHGRELGDGGTDQLPDHWIVQAQQQMILSDTGYVDFAVLIGGQRLSIHRVDRRPRLCESLAARVDLFWRNVQAGTVPAGDGRVDGRIMHLLYPDSDGEVELDAAAMALVDEYQASAEAERAAEDRKKTHRAALLELLGNHALGRLPDGRVVTRKVVNVPEMNVPRAAFSYAGLWVSKPKRKG